MANNTSTPQDPKGGEALVAQLRQIATGPILLDDNLIFKQSRDQLVRLGYVARHKGFNYLTRDGIDICIALEIIKEPPQK